MSNGLTGTIADDYNIQNVMAVHGYLDLGRTVAPVLCDKETWGKLMETRKKYRELQHMREYKNWQRHREEDRLVEAIIEGYNEFFEKLYVVIATRCKEKEEEQKKSDEQFERTLKRLEDVDPESAKVFEEMFNKQ